MCKWGDTVNVCVWIASDLACDGQEKYKVKKIDRCIAPIVSALSAAQIRMRGSCCGHGKGDGKIDLQDGRVLIVQNGSRDHAKDQCLKSNLV